MSRFTGLYLVFEVFQTKVVHFCFCLFRIKALSRILADVIAK